MFIKKLKNPLTEEYLNLKKIIFSDEFEWYTGITTENNQGMPFFSHTILGRPSDKVLAPEIASRHFNLTIKVLKQIVEHNDLNVNSFMRINVNYTFNQGGGRNCGPHYDHDFKHKNLVIYLNESSGPTVVVDSENKNEEYFYPKEDVIIEFEGLHYHYQPKIGENRVVLVATYI